MLNKCVLCDNNLITIYGNKDNDKKDFCEECGVFDTTAKFIKQSKCGAMTIEDLELITRTVIMTGGHYADMATKVYIDSRYAGTLSYFRKDIRETCTRYVLFNGQAIRNDVFITNSKDRTITLETIKEGM